MLSAAASNTLLKTLEEPPAHVVFVLATTDPQKVLPTIRSRTQHFEFTLLSHDELVEPPRRHPRPRGRRGRRGDARPDRARAARVGARRAVAARPGARGRQRAARRRPGAGRVRRCAVRAAARRARRGRERRRGRRARRRCTRCSSPVTTRAASPTTCCARCATRSCRRTRRAACPTTVRPRKPSSSRRAREGDGQRRARARIEILGQAIVDIRGQAIADPRLVLEVAVVRLARREARTREETLLDRVERLEARIGTGMPSPAAVAAGHRRPRAGRRRGARARTRPRCSPRARRGRSRAPREPVAAAPAPRVAAAATEPDAPTRRAERPRANFALDDVIEAWPGRARRVEGAGARRDPGRAADRDRRRRRSCSACPNGATTSDQRSLPQGSRRRSRTRSRRASARSRSSRCAPHDFDAPDALRRSPPRAVRRAGRPNPRPRARRDEDVDLDELTDAPDAPPPDRRRGALIADLGAEVVEERPRERWTR